MGNEKKLFAGTPGCLYPGCTITFGGIERDEVGIIDHVDLKLGLAMVNFQLVSVYLPLITLLILRDPASIRAEAKCNFYRHTVQDYQDIMEIAFFAESQQKKLKRLAIQLAQLSPSTLPYTMNLLSDALKREHSQYYGR